jgi:photosystem II stability/assembly factor-like uncharacterized protein
MAATWIREDSMARIVGKVATLVAFVSLLLASSTAGFASAAPDVRCPAGRSVPVPAGSAASAERVTRPALFAVSFADLRYGWAVGAQGAIFRTKDGGRHWVRQYLHGPWRVEEIVFGSVQAVSSKVCWVVGGSIYKTVDGGKTWTRMAKRLHPAALSSAHWRQVAFPTAKAGWVVSDSGDIIHTANGGKTWTCQRSGTSVDDAAGIVALDAKTAFIGDNSAGGHTLLATTDGIGWRLVGARPFWNGDPTIVDVCAASAKAVWLVAGNGEVLSSEDGGLTWRVSNPDPAPTIPYVGGAASYGATIFVFGADVQNHAVAMLSTDAGRTWLSMGLATAAGAKPFGISAVAFASARTFWLVDVAGDMFRTQDGGTTWQKQR